MPHFNEHALEQGIMELFQEEGYTYSSGDTIQKEASDVLLRDDLMLYLKSQYPDLSDLELKRVILKLTADMGLSLYGENARIMSLISNGFSIEREDSSKPNIHIRPIDFECVSNNIFRIVNQLEVVGIERRIPDGVVYINGLPVVVLEFKSAVKESATIRDAYTQLTVRYRRDIPELFRYNAFVVISDGVNSKYGSLFAPYDYFYAWRKVHPDEAPREGVESLLSMIHGLFPKERLLDVIHNFIFFPENTKKEVKIVCRYPQYFAARKLYNNILEHSRIHGDGDGKGGTYFGATGSGKSLTMLFLTRLLVRSKAFASPTIVLITDRTDLDDQLSELFVNGKKFIGDAYVKQVESREDLGDELRARPSGGVLLTTIHKFTKECGLLSDRANIICISDEAHRSQINLQEQVVQTEEGVKRSFGFAKYLHDSLPNATYVGFTGTPIDATIDVFGKVVDAYTMTEAVEDGITRCIVYEGRAAKVLLDHKKLDEIEHYYEQCAVEGANEYQIEESKKAVTRMECILGSPDRLQAMAEDFLKHYEGRIAEGSTVCGKAMIVCSNRSIAFDLYKRIVALRPEWLEKRAPQAKKREQEEELSYRMHVAEELAPYGEESKPIERIKLVMTRNKDDDKELYDLLGSDEERAGLAKEFRNPDSNFKVVIVVDMWMTGFDVPCLDTMYIDKPLQQHTLIQTISRVNRLYPGKEKGLVVDYIGIKKNMNAALSKYASSGVEMDGVEMVEESITMVKDELDILRRMFHGFDRLPFTHGQPLEQLECLKMGAEHIQATKELETRFMGHVRKMKSAYSLCSNREEISYEEREDIHFFSGVRSIIYKLTKGDTPDLSQMNARVNKMIEEAILSEGVEEIIQVDSKTEHLDLLSEQYMGRLQKLKLPNMKVKLMERLLKMVITDFKKVNKIKGVDFTERLNALVQKYNSRKDDAVFANDVINEVADQMAQLLTDINKEKASYKELGISYEEKAFYDILKAISTKFGFEYPEEKFRALAAEIRVIVDDKSKYIDWENRSDIKAELKMDLILVLSKYGYPPVTHDEVYKEIFEQAENFKKYAVS